MITGKTIALTIWIIVSKVLSLLFNMLSRFVIAFHPRSKHLLIFMGAVTIFSDFGAQENNVCHCFFSELHGLFNLEVSHRIIYFSLTFQNLLIVNISLKSCNSRENPPLLSVVFSFCISSIYKRPSFCIVIIVTSIVSKSFYYMQLLP